MVDINMFYFNIFPKVNYEVLGKKNILLTDITKRFKIVDNVINNLYIIYEYTVKDGERADVIAEKLYGDAKLDWIVYLTNQIIDPYFEWVLSYDELQKFVIKKYGSVEYAKTQIQNYYEIIQDRETLSDGTIVPEKTINIDFRRYQTLADEVRKTETIFQYEERLNEDRRIIKLIDKNFVPQIVREVKELYDR